MEFVFEQCFAQRNLYRPLARVSSLPAIEARRDTSPTFSAAAYAVTVFSSSPPHLSNISRFSAGGAVVLTVSYGVLDSGSSG